MSAVPLSYLTEDDDLPSSSIGGTAAYVLRGADGQAVEWRVDGDDGRAIASGSRFESRPAFKGLTIDTFLSESQLHARGLRLFAHEARVWLIDVDADLLVGDRSCAAWMNLLAERLDELRGIAREEELLFSEASAAEALAFAQGLDATQCPGAFLIGNGNVRLLWSVGPEQIGLQFKGNGTVQFVLFAKRRERIATVMGDDDVQAIPRQITAAGLRHLLRS